MFSKGQLPTFGWSVMLVVVDPRPVLPDWPASPPIVRCGPTSISTVTLLVGGEMPWPSKGLTEADIDLDRRVRVAFAQRSREIEPQRAKRGVIARTKACLLYTSDAADE